MKKLLILLIFFSSFLVGENKVTVIKPIKLDFSKYGVISETLSEEEIISLNAETERKLAESINKSLILIFGEQVKANVYKSMFSSDLIKESIKKMLMRGGLIFFGPTSWGILNRLPQNMKDFFKEIGAFLINVNNYKVMKTPQGTEKYFKGIGNPSYPHLFITVPNDLTKISKKWQGADSVRYFDNLPENCKPLIIDKKEKLPIVIIQENILGKGKIINSYSYSLMRTKEDAFWENIIVNLYRQRKEIERKEIIKKKLGIEEKEERKKFKVIYPDKINTSPKIDGKLDKIWEDAKWIELIDSKTGKTPGKKTKVGFLYDEENMYLFYICEEPNVSNLKAKTKVRDGRVWNDDCVEFILSPSKNTKYHLIINSKGIKYDAKNDNISWNPEYESATEIGNDFWTVELKLPFKIFEIDPLKNPVVKVGVFREEKQSGELSSLLPAPMGFAAPNSWGYLSFVSEKEFLNYIGKKKKKIFYEEGYLVWYDNPYNRKFADILPSKLKETKNIKVLIAKNEKECTNLLITNFTDENITFRIEPSLDGIRDNNGNFYPFDSIITLKEAVPRLNPYKEKQMDPLVKLDEGNLISVPPYETRQLWIDIKGNLPTGKYKTSISFVPVDNLLKEKKVEIEIDVVNFEFPDRLPLLGYTFGPYGYSWAKGKREEYFSICPEYHITHLQLQFPLSAIKKNKYGKIFVSEKKDDYFRKVTDKNGKEIIEEKLAIKYGEGWFYSYGIYFEFNRRLKNLGIPMHGPYLSEGMDEKEWKRIFKKWVSTWFKYLKEEGIEFSKFYIPLLDEPKDFITYKILNVAKILKEIEPSVQITLDPAKWTGKRLIMKLNPFVDLWIPHEARLISRGEESKQELEFYQKEAKKFAPYQCSPEGIVLPLLSYYRYRGIRTFLMRADGICLWNFNSWRRNDWNEFDDKNRDYHLFYHGDKGPIPSVRAEAFREGFEDYFLLISAEKKLKEKYDEEIARLISQNYLEGLIKKDDGEEILKWRNKLLNFLGR